MNQESYNWYRPDGFRSGKDTDRQRNTSHISDTNPSESSSLQIHTDSKHTSFFRLKSVFLIFFSIVVVFALIAGTAILGRNTDSSPSTSSLSPDSDTLEDNPTEEPQEKKDYSDFFEKVYGDTLDRVL